MKRKLSWTWKKSRTGFQPFQVMFGEGWGGGGGRDREYIEEIGVRWKYNLEIETGTDRDVNAQAKK